MGASSGATAPPDAPPVRRALDDRLVRARRSASGCTSCCSVRLPAKRSRPTSRSPSPSAPAGPLARWGVFVLCALGGLDRRRAHRRLGARLVPGRAVVAPHRPRHPAPGHLVPGHVDVHPRPGAHGPRLDRPHRPGRAGTDLPPGPTGRRGARRRRVVRARAARPADAQPRRLQLRLAGRDGQPGHRPHRQRPLRHEERPVGVAGRLDLAQRPGALRPGGGRGRQGRRRAHRARPGRRPSGASGPSPCSASCSARSAWPRSPAR